MKLKPKTRLHRQRRCGAAAVEFAVISPVLFIMVFGMIDVGRAVMVQNLLTNAARDGARTAVLDGVTSQEVITQVSDFLAASSVPNASVNVTPSDLTTAAQGDPVAVSASVPFNSVSWLPSSIYLKDVILESTVIMRREVDGANSGTASE